MDYFLSSKNPLANQKKSFRKKRFPVKSIMSIFSKIFSIFEKRKTIQINNSPLYFTDLAIEQITKHIESRPAKVKSAFKVVVAFKNNSYNCQVGFDDYKLIRKPIFEYPFPLIISEEDEFFLRGSYIDFHTEDKMYFHYPNVELEVIERISNSIYVFYINRNLISTDSPIQSIAIDQNLPSESYPRLIKQIFNTGFVESIFIEKNYLSIEKKKEIPRISFEEKIAEIILSYFEKCNYPLFITEFKIEEKRFEK